MPERVAGLGVLALLGATLIGNLVWVRGHAAELRPMGSGGPAPAFSLPRADGSGEAELASLRGRVVLIDFWATWCGPCAESMPIVERLYGRHRPAGLEVLSVNTDGGRDAARIALTYARRLRLEVPVLVDDGSVAARYRVTIIPHLVVVDREGVIRGVWVGVPPEAEVEALILALL